MFFVAVPVKSPIFFHCKFQFTCVLIHSVTQHFSDILPAPAGQPMKGDAPFSDNTHTAAGTDPAPC